MDLQLCSIFMQVVFTSLALAFALHRGPRSMIVKDPRAHALFDQCARLQKCFPSDGL